MTVETKCLVDLSDIISVEFACKRCGSKLLHSIAKFDAAPVACTNCKEDMLEERGPDAVAIEEAIGALRRLSNRSLPIQLRFEIAGVGVPKRPDGWIEKHQF